MKKKFAFVPGLMALTGLLLPLMVGAQAPQAAPVPSQLTQDRTAQEAAASSDLDTALFHQLLVAEMTLQQGNPAASFELMLDAARKTNKSQLYQRAIDIALQARAGDKALRAAQAWKQQQPDSRDANRYVLQILVALNRIAETAAPLKTEITLAPEVERAAVLSAVPRLYARSSDKKLATKVVQEIVTPLLAQPALASVAWASLARMRLAADDAPGALEAAQRSQASSAAGNSAEAAALVALELMGNKIPSAENLVRHYLEGNAKALPEIRMAYVRALLEGQRIPEAMTQLQTLTRDQADFAEGWLILGALQAETEQADAAQVALERYLKLAQNPESDNELVDRSRGLAQAYLALAELAEKRKDFVAAEGWLAKIDSTSDLARAQSRRASILARQGKLEEGRALIRQLPERNIEDVRLKLNAEVSLLREFKQYRAAYDLLAPVIVKTPDDVELLYEQSMLADKLGVFDDMERLLRRVIEIKPNHQHAYNALGYSLADRGVRLPEAKQLIEKALAFAPNDPFIRDSLAWVEFRLGNKAEAARILEAVYQARPDAEIAAHWGEVLWSLGERERAIRVWKEARASSPDNAVLLETLKRLAIKL